MNCEPRDKFVLHLFCLFIAIPRPGMSDRKNKSRLLFIVISIKEFLYIVNCHHLVVLWARLCLRLLVLINLHGNFPGCLVCV
jgi:hypothetical protein